MDLKISCPDVFHNRLSIAKSELLLCFEAVSLLAFNVFVKSNQSILEISGVFLKVDRFFATILNAAEDFETVSSKDRCQLCDGCSFELTTLSHLLRLMSAFCIKKQFACIITIYNKMCLLNS
jgi:predicted metal-binding protein